MNRKCIKYPLDEFLNHYPEYRNSKVSLFIDIENVSIITEIIQIRSKKFRMILHYILSGKYKNDLYSHEKISGKVKNITAMKFKEGKNERIYCKEIFKDGKKIVMITALMKKSQKISIKTKTLLENISGYEYEF